MTRRAAIAAHGAQPAGRAHPMSDHSTDFGYRDVPPSEKTRLVGEVFSSVAGRYDLMNDLMSFGAHRLWKRFAVGRLAPRRGQRILDLAGGTGDLTRLIHARLNGAGEVILSDVNGEMLTVGRDHCIDRGFVRGVHYVQANAEALPLADAVCDGLIIAFGLRNVTWRECALAEMHRVLRPGGRAVVLEFSHVVLPLLARAYDRYSFSVIPALGGRVAGDAQSYRYLVESIRRFPDQAALAALMTRAGFARVGYHNLSAGIVAVHVGYRL